MTKEKIKVINVEKCAVDICPYCMPDPNSFQFNWCNAYMHPQRISAKVKTFPNLCPLKYKE